MHILFDYNFSPLSPVDASYIFPATFRSDENFIMKQIKADQLCDAREIKKKRRRSDSRYRQYSALARLKTSLPTGYIYIYTNT